MTRLYFVRHGESISNLMTQFAGSLDMPLTDRGLEQARITASFLKKIPFSVVYASDLSRAFETGKAIAEMREIPIVGLKDLREIHAGDWEGKTYCQLECEFPDLYTVWKTQIGRVHCPNGESIKDLQTRVCRCISQIVQKHPEECVCIATHATPIRVMECALTDIPIEEMHSIPWVSNASVTIADFDLNGVGHLIAHDLHDHLGVLSTVLADNV